MIRAARDILAQSSEAPTPRAQGKQEQNAPGLQTRGLRINLGIC